MLSIFNKKRMNQEDAKAFWAWFEEREEWIINGLNNHDKDLIWIIDAGLKTVFPYFDKELEFQLGYNFGKGEFFFFHLGDKNLIRDSKIFGEMMPQSIAERWKFIIEK